MDHLFPLLLYFACTLQPYLTRLSASFHNISAAATVAVAKLDLQYGVAHSSHVVLVTCVRNLYTIKKFIVDMEHRNSPVVDNRLF